jgi:hypothetical protein
MLAFSELLTYMSTRELLKKRLQEGELVKLGFSIPGPPERRTVLMSPEINMLMSGPWKDVVMRDRCYSLRAELENILTGSPLTYCDIPREAKDKHQISRLDPAEDNIFDIRSVDPPPGLRIIFHFAERDVLVLHTCSPRSVRVSWSARVPLINDKVWRRAISESMARWSILFPGCDPPGGSIHEYLSNAIVG